MKNPIARKRIGRFKEVRRAYLSLWIIVVLYGISLFSEFICSNNPIYVRFKGRSYFPAVRFYPEDTFVQNGRKTRTDYKALRALPQFLDDPKNVMIFPLVPFGPYESINPKSIPVPDEVTLHFIPMLMVASVNITKEYTISQSDSFGAFSGKKEEEAIGYDLSDFFHLPESIKKGIGARFNNIKAPRVAEEVESREGEKMQISLSTFSPREKPPATVRVIFTETASSKKRRITVVVDRNGDPDFASSDPAHDAFWSTLSVEDQGLLVSSAKSRFLGPVDSMTMSARNRLYRVELMREEVQFPYPPVKGHLMGIDGAGRDVSARILYGLRTSLTFGLLLVACSMAAGIAAGALQGYYGGVVDITAQRLIEIWSALPFLYVMILMGSTYGRSFSILLFCYGIFNWIGISYYVRAEFLRLRNQGFVEAAKCLGVSSYKIIFKHILPNALIPVITFFPFYLVGAIGSLAALDYLGFGLPPPTPSWGELLFQAQQYRWAWWLILYPSLTLFGVMLLGIFIGEGARNAYDPKQYTRLE